MAVTIRQFARPKIAIAVIVALVLIAAAARLDTQALLRDALAWIAARGALAPAVFIALYICAAVLFVPGSILTIGSGFLFGLLWGSVYVSIGATAGATCAFLIGRSFARGWVARKLAGNAKFAAIDRAVGREGWKIVGLARLSPAFPFNLLNYAFGLTDVALGQYVIASWAGMIPGTVLYVYIGTLAGDLARIGNTSAPRTPARWALEIVGLLATVAVALYVTALARRALREKAAVE
jgi:uncharacterized membrane protein YdjX (TVP38/TMEM64 family)